MRRLTIALGLVLASVAPASSRGRAQGKSPHVGIAAVAQVETEPDRTMHKNRREFEEFDVTILSAERTPPGGAGGDFDPPIDRKNRVQVVHDLTCGGGWIDAKPGDRIEIKGEYVHPPRGRDLIHFTHPAGGSGSCGKGGRLEDGYIRLARPGAGAASGAEATPREDLFVTVVRPILAGRCLCHEKGGKMYERLPFDDPAVVSSHSAGVRRRLKGDDLAALERWLATLPQASSPGS